jgi:hypothetical protein
MAFAIPVRGGRIRATRSEGCPARGNATDLAQRHRGVDLNMTKLMAGSVGGAAGILLLWGGSAALLLYCLPESEAHGTFGDMFGAVNALFSGLAFLGVIIAIILQRQELELQREELRASREAQQELARSQREQLAVSTFHTKIEAMNHIINSYDREIKRIEAYSTSTEKEEHDRLVEKRDRYETRLKELLEYQSSLM